MMTSDGWLKGYMRLQSDESVPIFFILVGLRVSEFLFCCRPPHTALIGFMKNKCKRHGGGVSQKVHENEESRSTIGGLFRFLPREILALVMRQLDNMDRVNLMYSCNWMNGFPCGLFSIDVKLSWKNVMIPNIKNEPPMKHWLNATSYFRYWFRCEQEIDSIPITVKTIVMSRFVDHIPSGRFPQGLCNLGIGLAYKPEEGIALPKDLVELNINTGMLNLENGYIPNSVEILHLLCGFENIDWSESLPHFLVELHIDLIHHESTKRLTKPLPPTLKRLHFRYCIQSLEGILPESLEEFVLRSAETPIIDYGLPPKLTRLAVIESLCQISITSEIPTTLTDLRLGAHARVCYSGLPKSLKLLMTEWMIPPGTDLSHLSNLETLCMQIPWPSNIDFSVFKLPHQLKTVVFFCEKVGVGWMAYANPPNKDLDVITMYPGDVKKQYGYGGFNLCFFIQNEWSRTFETTPVTIVDWVK